MRRPPFWNIRTGPGVIYTTTNEAPPIAFMEFFGDNGKMVYQNGSLKLYSSKVPIPEFTFSTKEMWASPEIIEEKLELPQCQTGHKEIIRNFCRSILFGEELIAPGEKDIWSVEFINALILSGKKGKSVDIPIDREEYEELLSGLKKISRGKRVKASPSKKQTPQVAAKSYIFNGTTTPASVT